MPYGNVLNMSYMQIIDSVKHTPSLECFMFVVDGNSILLRKERHTRNLEAVQIWREIEYPSVSISKFLE
jgi:hypothetical protein